MPLTDTATGRHEQRVIKKEDDDGCMLKAPLDATTSRPDETQKGQPDGASERSVGLDTSGASGFGRASAWVCHLRCGAARRGRSGDAADATNHLPENPTRATTLYVRDERSIQVFSRSSSALSESSLRVIGNDDDDDHDDDEKQLLVI